MDVQSSYVLVAVVLSCRGSPTGNRCQLGAPRHHHACHASCAAAYWAVHASQKQRTAHTTWPTALPTAGQPTTAELLLLPPPCRPYLVVGPLSTLPNWVNEFKRFCPDFPVILYHGSREHRAALRAEHLQLRGAQLHRGSNTHCCWHLACVQCSVVVGSGQVLLQRWIRCCSCPASFATLIRAGM